MTKIDKKSHNFLIVRHPRQQVEHFVVGHTVRPDKPPAELDQAPQQQQHPDRDVVQHQGGGQQKRRRQPAQLWDGKVERAGKRGLGFRLWKGSCLILHTFSHFLPVTPGSRSCFEHFAKLPEWLAVFPLSSFSPPDGEKKRLYFGKLSFEF